MLKDVKIGVFISGGIAAYKIPDFVRRLVKLGANVRVAMTPNAQKFTTVETFEVLTKFPVLFDGGAYPDPVGHIHIADWLDLAIVVPATANTIAKLAQGIGDNEMLSALLAVDKPCLVVPAMNEKMWTNPASQRNIDRLKKDGKYVLEPGTGFLAEGYEGKGRMPEPEEIINAVQATAAIYNLADHIHLQGLKVVISAGGTQEAIDPVRYISNHSSGKMGLALAHVATLSGAQVMLVRTPSAKALPVLPEIQVKDVTTANDLFQVMQEEVIDADIVIMAAAVSDYRMSEVADQKLKKNKAIESNTLHLELVENPDILASLPKDYATVVGFAAETENVEANAQAKLLKKGADIIVANDVSRKDIGFGAEENAVLIVSSSGVRKVAKASKYEIAAEILLAAQAVNK